MAKRHPYASAPLFLLLMMAGVSGRMAAQDCEAVTNSDLEVVNPQPACLQKPWTRFPLTCNAVPGWSSLCASPQVGNPQNLSLNQYLTFWGGNGQGETPAASLSLLPGHPYRLRFRLRPRQGTLERLVVGLATNQANICPGPTPAGRVIHRIDGPLQQGWQVVEIDCIVPDDSNNQLYFFIEQAGGVAWVDIDDVSFEVALARCSPVDTDFQIQATICEGTTLSLTAVHGDPRVVDQWNLHGASEPRTEDRFLGEPLNICWGENCVFSGLAPGHYVVKHGVYSQCYPWAETRHVVTVNPLPRPRITVEESCCKRSLRAEGDPLGAFHWSTGSRSGVIDAGSAGVYTLTASTRCGTRTEQVHFDHGAGVHGDLSRIAYPPYFTPSQGPFRIYDFDRGPGEKPAYGATAYRLWVFDRWGGEWTVVNEHEDCSGLRDGEISWDGTFKAGRVVQEGAYNWQLELKNCSRGFTRRLVHMRPHFRRTCSRWWIRNAWCRVWETKVDLVPEELPTGSVNLIP